MKSKFIFILFFIQTLIVCCTQNKINTRIDNETLIEKLKNKSLTRNEYLDWINENFSEGKLKIYEIFFDYGLLDWIKNDTANPKRFAQLEYILEGINTEYYVKDLVTKEQKINYEIWVRWLKNYKNKQTLMPLVKSFKVRLFEYLNLDTNKIAWNNSSKNEIMYNGLNKMLKKIDLSENEIDLLFNGDRKDSCMIDFFIEKANADDKLIIYRIGILASILEDNIDRIHKEFLAKYKFLQSEVAKYNQKLK